MPSKNRITKSSIQRIIPPRESTLDSPKLLSHWKSTYKFPNCYSHRDPPPIPTTPISPALSSNVSTPVTPSPQITTFDNIVNKIVSKSLNAALTSKDAVLKEVRDCILTNNETRLKELNPYKHSYWRDLHVRSGCVV